MRFRNWLIVAAPLAVAGAMLFTDPDRGVATGLFLMSLAVGFLAVAAAHVSRKGLFDYLDLRQVAERAQQGPTGAGLVFVGVCIVLAALLGLFGRAAQAAVPPQAQVYLPMLSAEIAREWPGSAHGAYVAGLVDHESACPAPRTCWQPSARLRSAREEGAGLGQLTRAWSTNGAVRFDKLAELRQQHPALRELSWETVYRRPDLQLRAMVVMARAEHRFFSGRGDALAFADAAYNGGRSGVERDRRACAMTAGCDPLKWFGHVEATCTKSLAPLYGKRSACNINRHHVRDVLRVRMPLYQGLV